MVCWYDKVLQVLMAFLLLICLRGKWSMEFSVGLCYRDSPILGSKHFVFMETNILWKQMSMYINCIYIVNCTFVSIICTFVSIIQNKTKRCRPSNDCLIHAGHKKTCNYLLLLQIFWDRCLQYWASSCCFRMEKCVLNF